MAAKMLTKTAADRPRTTTRCRAGCAGVGGDDGRLPSTSIPSSPGPTAGGCDCPSIRRTAWVVESVPSAGPPVEVDGRVELELFVGGAAWLERLLLRLGPDARVIEPEEYRSLAGDAARRILRR